MTEPEFFDTNILLYAKNDDGTAKHKTANDLIRKKIESGDPYISAQVINEFAVNAIRASHDVSEIEEYLQEISQTFNVVPLTSADSLAALRIMKRYQFSFWDSLIVAVALKTGCTTLYTEDLQNGQIIDNALKVVNPFAIKKDEP
ncbi:MAG: PIN domain-containing protein [Termitinemataceae bacterium]|nr:MAG: PIN domain-containing protein [Termitinemataceae bacterium]